MNPRANVRTDEYGGSCESRLCFARESLAAIRASVDDKTVVGIRISVDELDVGGLSPDESTAVAKALADEELIDYVNVIGGSGASVGGAVHIVPPMFVDQGYLADPAAHLKRAVGVPTMLGGRINQPQTAEQIIAGGSGRHDMLGACPDCRSVFCRQG